MPGAVDLIGDPVLDNPTTARWFNTCTLTAAGARQSCASDSEQPAFQIRPENALDTTGARLEGVYRSEPLNRRHVVLQDRSGCTAASNFQFRVEMFNAFNKVQWANPNTTVTSRAVRPGHRDPVERPALRPARVPLQLLSAPDRRIAARDPPGPFRVRAAGSPRIPVRPPPTPAGADVLED